MWFVPLQSCRFEIALQDFNSSALGARRPIRDATSHIALYLWILAARQRAVVFEVHAPVCYNKFSKLGGQQASTLPSCSRANSA